VAAVAASRPGTLIGRLAALRVPRAGRRTRSLAARAAAAAREHATTLAAFAAVDLGAFEASRPAGWIVTGLSLLIVEWKVRG
jgi:uncharacterized MAPEG superfamily protein